MLTEPASINSLNMMAFGIIRMHHKDHMWATAFHHRRPVASSSRLQGSQGHPLTHERDSLHLIKQLLETRINMLLNGHTALPCYNRWSTYAPGRDGIEQEGILGSQFLKFRLGQGGDVKLNWGRFVAEGWHGDCAGARSVGIKTVRVGSAFVAERAGLVWLAHGCCGLR